MELIELQRRFVNQRFGMFIHFNSATFQFHQGDIVDWEFDFENHGAPAGIPLIPRIGIRISWTANNGPGRPRARA